MSEFNRLHDVSDVYTQYLDMCLDNNKCTQDGIESQKHIKSYSISAILDFRS